MYDLGFLIVGIVVGLVFGYFIGAQSGARYMSKRIDELNDIFDENGDD